MNKKDMPRAIRALFGMKKPARQKRKTPSKKELERKFVMRLDRNGKPYMKEIKDA